MTSEEQIKANRLNAENSTGPQTTEGKRKSSMNAIKHGLCASLVVLPGESKEAFLNMASKIIQCLQPENEIENELSERIIANLWKLKRLGFVESQLFEMFKANPQIGDSRYQYASAFLSMCRLDLPNKLTRYEHAIEASLYKALKKFEEMRSAGLSQNPDAD